MTLQEACVEALKILKQVMEEKLSSTNIEMATIDPKDKFKMLGKDELEKLIQALPK